MANLVLRYAQKAAAAATRGVKDPQNGVSCCLPSGPGHVIEVEASEVVGVGIVPH